MEKSNQRVYCAGPLFNPAEREEMAAIASALKDGGYAVFLPQEDGLRFADLMPILMERRISLDEASKMLNMAIFSLDVFEIMHCDGLVVNMNGRVPDEGAMVEAGIAWSHNKRVVIFKSDDRSLIHGSCNPLVMGLADFEYVCTYVEIPRAFDRKLGGAHAPGHFAFSSSFETASAKGEAISHCLARRRDLREIGELLITLFAEELCLSREDQNESFSPAQEQP